MIGRAYILTCAARREDCQRTLGRLRLETDWDRLGDSVRVVTERSLSESPEVRQSEASKGLLRQAGGESGGCFLFCEDDLTFNRYLRENLLLWPPLRARRQKEHFFGSLYNPGFRPAYRDEQAFAVRPEEFFGSQCLVIAPITARYFVAHWEEVDGKQDLRMAQLAARITPIWVHAPSLVQHVGQRSTWGGPWHQAVDFDPEWRAAEVRDEAQIAL